MVVRTKKKSQLDGVYRRTPMHTRTYPTHALNLINHMKLHVNMPNTKKAEEQRKKKEQESAEAISGLKIEDRVFCQYFEASLRNANGYKNLRFR